MAPVKNTNTTTPQAGFKPAMKGKLYASQAQLPKLPVPKLEDTIPKYLRTIEPFLTKEELENSKQAVQEFVSTGVANELQKRLEARAAEHQDSSWLYEWWNEYAYLGYRDPVVPYVSYYYGYKDDYRFVDSLARAASMVSAGVEFWKSAVDESLEPEKIKGAPLCSISYQYMFNTCRIPKIPSDYPAQYDPLQNQKITVARNGIFFTLPIIHDGKYLTREEIYNQLARIVEKADGMVAPQVGILSSDNRDNWAQNRDLLIQGSEINRANLADIESSIFLLCLDSDKPVTQTEFSRRLWHGNYGFNRFFDKPCQFIVFDNGKAGFMGEHSMMDGTPTLRFNDYVSSNIDSSPIDLSPIRTDLPAAKPLIFETNAKIVRAMTDAQARFKAEIDKQQLSSVMFHGYGKQIISKTFGISPDAYAQMLIQLAYYKLHRRFVGTYEPAQTRKFLCGRTEAGRVVSNESVAWVKSMLDPSVPNAERARLLTLATGAHAKYLSEAGNGQGVDRHLFGLKQLLKQDEKTPSIFTDPAYKFTSTWAISTSNLSNEYFTSWGWGEVVPHGYGVAYSVNKDELMYNVTCQTNEHNLNAANLAQCLVDAAVQTKAVLTAVALEKTKAKL
ncbi:Carnitine O-acetyltransferase, mitochondrial [Zancudomyces culisetae]|uniref:Carnitine O-acetyltransferase, mitochondrial n=1 Tax=Zancudomyces culisetae TaxID=1213189 RepID=A0A1R1PC15_ZANCU|nr:Carnitine O-acetyltransferase, mitochondrial [Zancudomyces culisetae]|eukprot:OMH78508.1 Carnitine O-acetyltransferase, mitochondrial [Zancudomyces culisetae]